MKSIFEKNKTKSEFPELTEVRLVKDPLGYCIKREGADEVLDIPFSNPSEAGNYALHKNWIVLNVDEIDGQDEL